MILSMTVRSNFYYFMIRTDANNDSIHRYTQPLCPNEDTE